ncbi:hypothetical protein IV203_002078 [Nitzschia inconspicua]|uniref:DUF6824 domain-containing protein n=1 Tax=Nitzschia inconspicua TaxID=303405 RepID=A0A9K3L9G4_9STRA|nr:hypothetical protein IV203_002078 [Nitzschia inconspicua]
MNTTKDDTSPRAELLPSRNMKGTDSPDRVEATGASTAANRSAVEACGFVGSSSDQSYAVMKEDSVVASKSSAKPAARTSSTVETPTDQDVLFGRGRPYQSHPGNVNLHRLVALHKDRYERSRRFDKLAIADQIVYEIKSGGGKTPGRFLRRVEGKDYWEEAPDDVSREKVAHALRGQIKQSRENRKHISNAVGESACINLGNDVEANVAAAAASLSSPCSLGSNTRNPTAQIPSTPISDHLSSLLQQQRNVDVLRHAFSTGSDGRLPPNQLTAAYAAQQQQLQQLQHISNLGALQQGLGAIPQPTMSADTLARILAARQQERNLQEQLLLLQSTQQSNDAHSLASFLVASNSNDLQNLIFRDQSTLDHSLALLQNQINSRNTAMSLSSLLQPSSGGGFDLGRSITAARALESEQIQRAIEMLIRGQQASPRQNETKEGRESSSSREGWS